MTQNVGSVMVVGGGISGVQAALDLADSGFKVYLVERKPSIGGVMAQLDKTFPTNDCSMCILSPKLVELARNPMITMMTLSEVIGVEGQAPDFKVTVKRHPRYVSEERCVGCGLCAEKCPAKAPNEYDLGLVQRKAIYVPYAQAVPMKYAIDAEKCLYLTKNRCGNCKKVCPADAVDYEQKETIEKVEVGAIVLAPGYEVFDARLKREYGYGEYKNVVSSLEFERILSATGPFQGHAVRPSDHVAPRKVAFLQCVGSRDEKVGNPYCSSVCCMYAIKEAIIAQEHTSGLKATIFFMDVRAVGKEFEDYRERAEREYGIEVLRGTRVASVEEDPATNNLLLRYSVGDEVRTEEFDLVVLSVGFEPPADALKLSEALGIKLNRYGFAETPLFEPLSTSRKGVYVTGAFSSPKDIPQSVAEASGAASKAGGNVFRNRIKFKKEEVAEVDVTGQEPRIGVFVCDCGINIRGTVDVPRVVEYAKTLPNVVWSEEGKYSCSADFQEIIKKRIKEQGLNRVVVASCTPRTHEPLFQSTIREAGLNPYLFEMANIRDQCSWVHVGEPEKATEKSMDLVRMAVAKSRYIEPLPTLTFPVGHRAAVIGGGLTGMTAALEIAAQEFKVDLIERSSELGGNLRMTLLGPDGKTGPQLASELISEVAKNANITVHLDSKIEDILGYAGNFTVRTDKGTIDAGAIIVATGAHEYRPSEHLYGHDKRVLTQNELEKRLANSQLDAKRVVMIQCVGSRNEDAPYCSRICCTTAIRNALWIKEVSPKTEVYVLHKDIRTIGLREELYREAGEKGINFIRFPEGASPEVTKEGSHIQVRTKDVILGEDVAIRPDLVVLSAGIRPNPDNDQLAKMLKVPLSKDGFFLEAHMKLRPVDFATEGIFLAGLAHWPKFAEESIAQASGAAARAMTIISKDELTGTAFVPVVDEAKCRACRTCEEVCAFKAVSMKEVSPGIMKASVNAVLCKGCGGCAAVCPTGAIASTHFTDKQLLAAAKSTAKEETE
ncbi:MAG TPA: CoB--CoM heterodisulfide reductase iron-sulfur subunit A family protein [Methanomassiliicoccales archaeon]|nr:CoB--CoM heterodisulfide reductase iron-sulfur subunit A family protein [Methanomassiliicoccales archaeon]